MAKDDFSRLEARWRKRPLFLRPRPKRRWKLWLAAALLAGLALVALADQLHELPL